MTGQFYRGSTGEVVSLKVRVSDDSANQRDFDAGSQTVLSAPPIPENNVALALFDVPGTEGVLVTPNSRFWQTAAQSTLAGVGTKVGSAENLAGTYVVGQSVNANRPIWDEADNIPHLDPVSGDYLETDFALGAEGSIFMYGVVNTDGDDAFSAGARDGNASSQQQLVITHFGRSLLVYVGSVQLDTSFDVGTAGSRQSVIVTWGGGDLKVYVEGQEIASTTYSAPDTPVSGNPIAFFRYNEGGGSFVGSHAGRMWFLGALNRAMTPTEVADLVYEFRLVCAPVQMEVVSPEDGGILSFPGVIQPWEWVALPAYARLPSGRQWVAAEVDPVRESEGSGNTGAIMYKDAGDTGWTLHSHVGFPGVLSPNIGSIILWAAPDGSLWFLSSGRMVICENPDDANPVWGEPFFHPSRGQRMLPFQFGSDWFLFIELPGPSVFSSDHPSTSGYYHKINIADRTIEPLPEGIIGDDGISFSFDESMGAELANGDRFFTRRATAANGGIHFKRIIGGVEQNWFPITDFDAFSVAVSRRPNVIVTENNNVAIIANDGANDTVGRLAISTDGGQTFPASQSVVFDSREVTYFYTVNYTLGADSIIQVCYDHGRGGDGFGSEREIIIATMTESDVIANGSSATVTQELVIDAGEVVT